MKSFLIFVCYGYIECFLGKYGLNESSNEIYDLVHKSMSKTQSTGENYPKESKDLTGNDKEKINNINQDLNEEGAKKEKDEIEIEKLDEDKNVFKNKRIEPITRDYNKNNYKSLHTAGNLVSMNRSNAIDSGNGSDDQPLEIETLSNDDGNSKNSKKHSANKKMNRKSNNRAKQNNNRANHQRKPGSSSMKQRKKGLNSTKSKATNSKSNKISGKGESGTRKKQNMESGKKIGKSNKSRRPDYEDGGGTAKPDIAIDDASAWDNGGTDKPDIAIDDASAWDDDLDQEAGDGTGEKPDTGDGSGSSTPEIAVDDASAWEDCDQEGVVEDDPEVDDTNMECGTEINDDVCETDQIETGTDLEAGVCEEVNTCVNNSAITKKRNGGGKINKVGKKSIEADDFDWSPVIKKVVVPTEPRRVCIVKVIPIPVTKDGKPWKANKIDI